MATDTPYTARVRVTELLERGKAQNTVLEIYRDGSQVTPSSATYTLIKPNGEFVVEDGGCTILGSGSVQYAHTPAQLSSSLILGEGYVQEYNVTIDGSVFLFRRMAAVVLRRLYPVISDADLEEVYTDLANLRPSTITSYQQYLDSAWYTILRRLRNHGQGYEYLVTSPESFAEAHRHLTLYLIFRDFHSGMSQGAGSRYLELAQEHYRLYQDEFSIINFVYDEGHKGQPDEPDKRTAGQPAIYLNRPGEYMYRRRFNR
jgi:hypothetical protein